MEPYPITPFLSEGSPYPLLTAWYYGRLRDAWRLEYSTSREAELTQKRPEAIGHEVAARMAVELSMEYERLTENVMQRVQVVDSTDDPFIQFYDALQDEKLPSYRQVLQDVSGSRTLSEDEQEYWKTLLQKEEGETL